MSGCMPAFSCEFGKVEEPLCIRHDKDKQVRLKEGVDYPAGTLLTSKKDADPTVWTAWAIGDEICGVIKCGEDLTKFTEPCPVVVLTHGCVNYNRIPWPVSEDETEQAAINQAVKEVIANEKCCLQFDAFQPGCV